MSNAPDVAVIVVAAGSGTRLGDTRPKAFVDLVDRTILEHGLSTIAGISPRVDVVVVAPLGWEQPAREIAAASGLFDVTVVTGGATRHASVATGLASVSPRVDVVLVHDAARALTPQSVFTEVIAAVRTSGHGIVPAIPVADAMKRVEGAHVLGDLSREGLVAVQTPQGFPRGDLDDAYSVAANANHPDDASVFMSAGFRVDSLPGHEHAFKITYPSDVLRARALVSGLNDSVRVGTASDTHAFGDEKGLRLAGLDWPDELALAGHSDGDAVAHAIVDALLVAAGLGDIGALVGTDDPQFAGASGEVFISRAVARLAEHGWHPVNVTAQIIGNRPRLSSRRIEAESVLTEWVGAPVSLSATTTDGLGFTGEDRGIAVIATALVARA